MHKVTQFTVDTDQGTIQVSMRSTGSGAWVAASPHNPRPLGTQITPVQWVRDAGQVANMIGVK